MKKTLISIEKNKLIVQEENQYLFKKIKENLKEMEITINKLKKEEEKTKKLLKKQIRMLR